MISKIVYLIFNLLIFRTKFIAFIKEYNLIKKNQYKSIENNLEIQRERLYNLLNYAINNVPFYKKFENKINKDTIFKDIKNFPIITKDVIRKQGKSLISEIPFSNYKINTSGGTTGEPIRLLQDKLYYLKVRASELAFDEIAGYNLGDKLIKLWGNEKEIYENKKTFVKHFTNEICKNITFLNSFLMSDTRIHEYIDIINKLRPNVIIGYVQSLYELSKFIKRKGRFIIPVNSVITSAGVLTQNMRKLIKNTFKCNVFNRYGSREIGIIATSCEKADKLHINMFQNYIEILDNNGKSLNFGEKGNIVITSLVNFMMPMIRYKIGDRGSLNNINCSCGRHLIRLDNVFGRSVDVFKNKKGDLIDGEYFTHLFYFRDKIKQFQVIQKKLDEIDIDVVTYNNERLNTDIQNDIIDKIQLVMGKDCKICFKYVLNIKPSSSGKYRYIISKVYDEIKFK